MKFLKNQAGFAPSVVVIIIFVVAVAAFGAYRIKNSEAYWRRGRTDTYQLKATAQLNQGSGATVPVVSLFWKAQKVNGLASYRIVRLDPGAKAYKTLAEVNNTTYADRTVSYNTSYTYNVVAIDKSGKVLSFGSTVAVTTPAEPQAAVPQKSFSSCREGEQQVHALKEPTTPLYADYSLTQVKANIPYAASFSVRCQEGQAIGAHYNNMEGAVNVNDIRRPVR